MKFLIKSLVAVSIVCTSSVALACHNNGQGRDKKFCEPEPVASVPELDVAAAPLAILLLGGILAAGFERRRKISIK